MKTRILKLINDERTNVRIASKKGYGACTGGAVDICPSASTDLAFCTTYAYDYCSIKDRSACSEGADDTCGYDTGTSCKGPGQEDNT